MSLPPLIDCHAHLCDPVFDPDLREVHERARAAGVGAIVAVGETLENARRNRELAELHPAIDGTGPATERALSLGRTARHRTAARAGCETSAASRVRRQTVQRLTRGRSGVLLLHPPFDRTFSPEAEARTATAGERNEPANVRVALQAIAELKDVPELEVAERVRDNTRRLLGPRLPSDRSLRGLLSDVRR